MNRLIGDLLDVASIDAGKLAVNPLRGDWTGLIAEAAATFKAAASAKAISLRTEIAGQPLLGKFDHDRMLQVLGNLLSNSIKSPRKAAKSPFAASASERSFASASATRARAYLRTP